MGEYMNQTRPVGVTSTNNPKEKSFNSCNQENGPEELVGSDNINENNLTIYITYNSKSCFPHPYRPLW